MWIRRRRLLATIEAWDEEEWFLGAALGTEHMGMRDMS